jgi:hypothetical protein
MVDDEHRSNGNEGDYPNMSTANPKAPITADFDASKFSQQDAVDLLAFANNADNPMADRILARDQADSIRKELSIGKSKIGQWPTLDGDGERSSNGSAAPAGKTTKANKTAKSTAPAAPLVPGIIYVRNELQKFLFEKVLIPNITKEGGRWTKSRPDGHAEPFKIATVVVDPDNVGITFGADAKKRNYNMNDSTWLQPDIIKPMTKEAEKVLGRELPKKELVSNLEDLKKIFGMDQKAHEVVAKPAEPETKSEEQSESA